jgi:hypothetical protein
MSIKIVGKPKRVKDHQRERLIEEAIRLNGSASSFRGKQQLLRFAKNKLGIVINDKILRQLLGGQQNGTGAQQTGKPPKCKTRSVRCASRNTF